MICVTVWTLSCRLLTDRMAMSLWDPIIRKCLVNKQRTDSCDRQLTLLIPFPTTDFETQCRVTGRIRFRKKSVMIIDDLSARSVFCAPTAAVSFQGSVEKENTTV